MDRFITRFEFESRVNQMREDNRQLAIKIDSMAEHIDQIKEALSELKFGTLRYILTSILSFFIGGGGITLILKVTGKI